MHTIFSWIQCVFQSNLYIIDLKDKYIIWKMSKMPLVICRPEQNQRLLVNFCFRALVSQEVKGVGGGGVPSPTICIHNALFTANQIHPFWQCVHMVHCNEICRTFNTTQESWCKTAVYWTKFSQRSFPGLLWKKRHFVLEGNRFEKHTGIIVLVFYNTYSELTTKAKWSVQCLSCGT